MDYTNVKGLLQLLGGMVVECDNDRTLHYIVVKNATPTNEK